MKVKELLKKIEQGKNEHPDFLEWTVALEHMENPKQDINCKDDIIGSYQFGEEWKFLKSHCQGCCTYFTKEKVFGIQIHY